MSMLWVGVGTAVLGTATSLYGANKQAGAIKSAAAQNAQSQADQNAAQWAAYLMTRGVSPNGATTGQIPTNPVATNARLPLWANVDITTRTPQPRMTGGGLTLGARLPPRRTTTLARGAPTGGGALFSPNSMSGGAGSNMADALLMN